MKYLSAIPAYGRDYKSKAEVLADWHAGKDFLVQDIRSSGYINKQDADAEGVTVNLRYKRATLICVVKPGSPAPKPKKPKLVKAIEREAEKRGIDLSKVEFVGFK